MPRKKLQDLNLCDNFLFISVMEDEEIARRVLEKILDMSINHVKLVQTEYGRDVIYDAHGIRLDVFLTDDDDNFFCRFVKHMLHRQ